MKKIFTAVSVMLTIVAFAQTAPAIEWQKALGGSLDDNAKSIQQTTDSGYIVAGVANSNSGNVSGNHGSGDYWIVKLGKGGKTQWQKCLGGSSDDQASSIQQTADGGYIVAGISNSNNGDVSGNHGGGDYWIVKLNKNGNIQWQKCLGGGGYDYAASIRQTTDSGYIVAGTSYSNDGDVSGNHGSYDYWIVKLNKNGNMQWQKCLGGSSDDGAASIHQTADSGYIVGGYSLSNDKNVSGNHGYYDYWIVKLNKNGNMQWQKCLGGKQMDQAKSVQQTTDGGYIVAGFAYSNDGDVSNNHGTVDYWIVKLNKQGNIQWQKCFGGSDDDRANSIQQTTDSGYIVAGHSVSNDKNVSGNHGYYDYWIVKLNKRSEKQWQKCLGGSNDDRANSIQQTKDNGYIVAGYSLSNDKNVSGNHGSGDYWIVKLSADNSSAAPVNLLANTNERVNNNANITVLPNPVKDILHIQGLSSSPKTISVIDANGKLLHNFVTTNSNYSFSVAQLNAGIYCIRITEGDKTKLLRFVKE
jgi:hypothetical protein